MLAMETGWPPPELLVTVSMTSGMCSAPGLAAISASSAATSMLPLKSSRAWVSAAAGMGRSTARGAGEFDVGAGGIEVGIAGHHMAGLAHHGEEDALGGAALVGGNHVAEAGEIVDHALQAEKAFAAGVGFVAAHQGGPLLGGHGAGARIGQQVDQDVAGLDQKQVVARRFKQTLALFERWCGAAVRRF